MNEDIVIVSTFFFTVIVLALGIPIVRAWVRRQERTPVLPPYDPARDERMARIEHAVEAIAVEVERISEGQRFVTRLLAERETPSAVAAGSGRKALPHEPDESPR